MNAQLGDETGQRVADSIRANAQLEDNRLALEPPLPTEGTGSP